MINNKKTIDLLVKKYGSPLYIFDKNKFIENYKLFNSIMSECYDKYQLSYSFKTNYAPYICKIVKQLGGYAEVVSDMEYSIAKKIGYKDKNIIYNGPYKGELSLRLLLNGGKLNIDSIDELNRIIDFAKKNKKHIFNIGLRLNFDIGQNFVSRFGLDINKELKTVINIVKTIDNIKIAGLHCHIGKSRSIKSWENRCYEIIKVIDKYFNDINLEYIDLGSGMYGKMEKVLEKQFGDNLPKYKDYANAIGKIFNDYYKNTSYKDKPTIYTEPGATLINSYVDFVSTVFSIKKIQNKYFVVLDCSKHNLGEICTLKKLPISIVHNNINNKIVKNSSIVGYTCLEHDVMYENYSGKISIGDYIVFGNIGGYSNVSKPPFILPNCAMISVEDNKTRIIKRKEKFEDVIQTYSF